MLLGQLLLLLLLLLLGLLLLLLLRLRLLLTLSTVLVQQKVERVRAVGQILHIVGSLGMVVGIQLHGLLYARERRRET